MSSKHIGSKSQLIEPHKSNNEPIKYRTTSTRDKSVNKTLHLANEVSSNELLDNKHCFDRYLRGSFWSPGKFYRSVGDMDTATVLKYARNQRLLQSC
jgi:REP element-mobilizing transposase RayT